MLEEIWIVIESFDKLAKQEQAKPTPNDSASNGSSPNHNGPASNGLKRKLEEIQEPVEELPSEQQENVGVQFDWITEIKNACSKNQENQIKFKKLVKKVRNNCPFN